MKSVLADEAQCCDGRDNRGYCVLQMAVIHFLKKNGVQSSPLFLSLRIKVYLFKILIFHWVAEISILKYS